MLFIGEVSEASRKESSPSRKARFRPAMNLPRNLAQHFHGRKKAYRRRTQCLPSSESHRLGSRSGHADDAKILAQV